jgi:hypothetical protein
MSSFHARYIAWYHFNRQPTDDTPIHNAGYANASIAPLVHGGEAHHNDDAPPLLKHPRHGLPREAGQRGDLSHGAHLFVFHENSWDEKTYIYVITFALLGKHPSSRLSAHE